MSIALWLCLAILILMFMCVSLVFIIYNLEKRVDCLENWIVANNPSLIRKDKNDLHN